MCGEAEPVLRKCIEDGKDILAPATLALLTSNVGIVLWGQVRNGEPVIDCFTSEPIDKLFTSETEGPCAGGKCTRPDQKSCRQQYWSRGLNISWSAHDKR